MFFPPSEKSLRYGGKLRQLLAEVDSCGGGYQRSHGGRRWLPAVKRPMVEKRASIYLPGEATRHNCLAMETIQRLTHRLLPPKPFTTKCLKPMSITRIHTHTRPVIRFHQIQEPVFRPESFISTAALIIPRRNHSSSSTARAGWFLGIGEKKQVVPDIVKAGDPVLHEPAREVRPEEIGSSRIQDIIDDMVKVMRKAPGVGLAAPQIGIPLKIIVLEDTKEYISYAPKQETEAQDRKPFDLLVVINPVLKKKGNKTALFFEGCLSVDGYRAVVERHLEVEVTGLDRHGKPMKVNASGWQARIFQHECDHLDGTIYVDRMVPRTFRTVENLDLPLAIGCPKLGVRY